MEKPRLITYTRLAGALAVAVVVAGAVACSGKPSRAEVEQVIREVLLKRVPTTTFPRTAATDYSTCQIPGSYTVEVKEVRVVSIGEPYRVEVLGMYHTDYPVTVWIDGICTENSNGGQVAFRGQVDAILFEPDRRGARWTGYFP